jgi:tRNA (guanine37-N1)-methyltransferase
MKVAIVTLFPELFGPFVETSFVKRAITLGALTVHLESVREHGLGKHRSVDDTPYGGGSGMVMRVDCVVSAIETAEQRLCGSEPAQRILLTPQGERLCQSIVRQLVELPALVLVCGRYEGFDERTREFVQREVSLGDFVLTGGEVAAMALLEACVRLLPGVLGNADSPRQESFSPELGGLLEYPQYTRPAEFRGRVVPEILKSGDHARIEAWRHEQARRRTELRRPDLVSGGTGSDE